MYLKIFELLIVSNLVNFNLKILGLLQFIIYKLLADIKWIFIYYLHKFYYKIKL